MFIGELEAFYIVRSNCFKYITVLTMLTLDLLDTQTTQCGNRLDNPACSKQMNAGIHTS
jgi:hypothetical protein